MVRSDATGTAMMPDVLLIDWLGRGGIAQLTDTWRVVLESTGLTVRVVSRGAAHLATDRSVEKRIPGLIGAADAHVRLVRAVTADIRRYKPRVVVLQNYWAPMLELPVLAAASRVGARVIVVVHNHRPHEVRAGVKVGLGSLLRRADVVLTHTAFVRDNLGVSGVTVRVVEHPVQLGVHRLEPQVIPELEAAMSGPVAVMFGVLRRTYKGAALLTSLGSESAAWTVVAAGVGAQQVDIADVRHDHFLTDAELRWLVSGASAVLLPYSAATQSGAVVLAQSLGTPPLATAVGGIPEQICDGRSGLLIPANAPSSEWSDRLRCIRTEPEWWTGVGRSSADEAWGRHERAASGFVEAVTDLL